MKYLLAALFAASLHGQVVTGGTGGGGGAPATWPVTGTPAYLGATSVNQPVNAQTGTSYTFVNADCGKLVTFSNASAIAVTLPRAAAGGNFVSGCAIDLENIGAGAVTITPTTSTLNGSVSSVFLMFDGGHIVSDGTNYSMQTGRGVKGGTNLTTQFSIPYVTLTPGQVTQLVPGAAGLPLISNGAGVAPSFGAISGTNVSSPVSTNELPLTFSGPLVRTVNAVACATATASVPGCISTADFNTFNGKRADLPDPALFKWYTGLRSATPTIAVLGDSISFGTGAANTPSGYANLLAPKSQAQYGLHSNTFATTFSAPFVQAGTWTTFTGYGPYAPAIGGSGTIQTVLSASGTGNTLSFPLQWCDSFDIYYLQSTDTASGFAVSIDSVGKGTFGAVTQTVPTWAKVTVAAGSLGTHSLLIAAPASGNVYIFGVAPTTGSGGLNVYNVGLIASASNAFANSGATNIANNLGFLVSMAPHLVIVELGVNDFKGSIAVATFQANLDAVVNYCKNTIGASVLVLDTGRLSPDPIGGQTRDQYYAATKAVVAIYGVGYLNVSDRWGTFAAATSAGLMSDNVHPSTTGHADMASFVLSRIIPDWGMLPGGNVVSATDTGATMNLPSSLTLTPVTFGGVALPRFFNTNGGRRANQSGTLNPGMLVYWDGGNLAHGNRYGWDSTNSKYVHDMFAGANTELSFSIVCSAGIPAQESDFCRKWHIASNGTLTSDFDGGPYISITRPNSGGDARIQLSNTDVVGQFGVFPTDGAKVVAVSNHPVSFGTNSIIRARVPAAGGFQLVSQTPTACTSALEGTQYYLTGTPSTIQWCMRKGDGTYALATVFTSP
jgi:lysophospholipase L1-like esterase